MNRAVPALLACLLVACSIAGDPLRSDQVGAETATHSPRPSAKSTPKPKVVSTTRLKGTGSKRGRAVVLQGDYVLKHFVTTKPGCRHAVYLVGFASEPLSAVDTDTAGSSSGSIDEHIPIGSYRLRVKSSECGSWSVSLSRP